jgi:hypothetical protein
MASNNDLVVDPKLELKSYIVNSIANVLFFTIDPFIESIPIATSIECKVPTNWGAMIDKYGFCNEAKRTIAAIQASGAFDNSADSVKDIYAAYECENCKPCCSGAAQISVSKLAKVTPDAYSLFLRNISYTLSTLAQLHSAPASISGTDIILNLFSIDKINNTLESLKKVQTDISTGTIGETIFVGILVDEVIDSQILSAIDSFIDELGIETISKIIKIKPNLTSPNISAANPSKLKSLESGRLAQAIKNKLAAGSPKDKESADKGSGLSTSWIAFIILIACFVIVGIAISVYSWRSRPRSLNSDL